MSPEGGIQTPTLAKQQSTPQRQIGFPMRADKANSPDSVGAMGNPQKRLKTTDEPTLIKQQSFGDPLQHRPLRQDEPVSI